MNIFICLYSKKLFSLLPLNISVSSPLPPFSNSFNHPNLSSNGNFHLTRSYCCSLCRGPGTCCACGGDGEGSNGERKWEVGGGGGRYDQERGGRGGNNNSGKKTIGIANNGILHPYEILEKLPPSPFPSPARLIYAPNLLLETRSAALSKTFKSTREEICELGS